MYVHIVCSTLETPTAPTTKNISSGWLCLIPSKNSICNTQFSWPRNTLWMETPEGNTLIFRKVASLGFLDTFSSTSPLPPLCAHPSEAPLLAALRPPLQCQGSPWSLCCGGCLFKKPMLGLENPDCSQMPGYGAHTFHSTAMWPRATYVAFPCLGLHTCKMGIMVSYRIVVKIARINTKCLESCLAQRKFSVCLLFSWLFSTSPFPWYLFLLNTMDDKYQYYIVVPWVYLRIRCLLGEPHP